MNINELELENIGQWPSLFKGVFILIVCSLIIGGFYYFVVDDQLKSLETHQAKEVELKRTYEAKAALAANVEVYREQMVQIEAVFARLLKKLPSNKEIAALLDDISFIGIDNGLQFRSINWGKVQEQEFSVEVPISIEVVGTYDQIGYFSAEIAKLPRIVILDNLRLTKPKGSDARSEILNLKVIAKTYRYKEDK